MLTINEQANMEDYKTDKFTCCTVTESGDIWEGVIS